MSSKPTLNYFSICGRGELARRPPGEGEDAGPAALTPLGERLVGLVPWS